jgi:hypothetical protein
MAEMLTPIPELREQLQAPEVDSRIAAANQLAEWGEKKHLDDHAAMYLHSRLVQAKGPAELEAMR